MMMISEAPSWYSWAAMARAEPPAPRITALMPMGFRLSLSESIKPRPSVLWPINWLLTLRMVFTAPQRTADSSKWSKWGMTVSLWGTVTLTPVRFSARIEDMAVGRLAGVTWNGM